MPLDRNGALLSILAAMPHSNTSTERVVLFKTAWLEKLTVVSAFWFIASWSVLLPLIALAGWGAVGPLAGAALFVAGLIVWSLFEYAVHRFVFHWHPKQSVAKWLVFVMHGNHHTQPNDPLRNLMPLVLSVPIAASVWAACVAVMGSPGTWLFLGWISGYVAYDLVHYACHQWPMRGRWSALKRHHMRHHHVDPEANYAITGVFWDRVFGSRITSLKR